MSATSVTGKGAGAAGSQKGPGNGRNYFVPMVNPHIVAAGEVTMSGGTATVTFPAVLPLAASNYVVLLTVRASAGAAHEVAVSAKTDVSSQFSAFTVVGAGATDVVGWCVVRAGFGLDF